MIDQRGLKTLVVWLLWTVTSASVLFMLYREAGAWTFIVQDHTHITQIILGLFLFGVVVNFFHVCVLTMEWFRAYRLEKEIRKKGLLPLKIKKSTRLVERIMLALQHILQQHGSPDVESLLMTSFSSQYRMCDFVLLMGNLLITMGLVGTVLGMTLTMTGLNHAMSAVGEDQRLVLEGVNHAMAGMGVAFYTTLLGSIFGGVLLRVFAWITKASVESLQDMLMHTLLVYGVVMVKNTETRDMQLLDANMQHLTEHTALLQQALAGSRREMGVFREELQQLQQTLVTINSDETMRNIAKGHAVFFRDARRNRGFFSFFKASPKQAPSENQL
ncbi:MAG: MotA/TolQ/ExbB proton channel family protein [Mariprofundaceae bacterium]|nr:MotA/TolQ/ExbB proton channel family protein [Mariprofundaceae bacterium]